MLLEYEPACEKSLTIPGHGLGTNYASLTSNQKSGVLGDSSWQEALDGGTGCWHSVEAVSRHEHSMML